MKEVDIPYIRIIRQELGLKETDNSKDKSIESMRPMQRLRLISNKIYKDPGLVDQFKSLFEGQGMVVIDKSKYKNMNIFLKRVEEYTPTEPRKKSKYLTMVEVLKEIFNECG